MAIELEIARALAIDEAFPDGDLTACQVLRQLCVRPRVAIAPVQPVANVPIKPPTRVDRDPIATNKANVAVWRWGGAELRGRSQLQVRPNDFYAATQCDFSFSRWRAALARLPHVAMSHQRRRPFFVLSKNTRWQRGSAQRRTRDSSPRMSAAAADSTTGMTRPANASPTGTNERMKVPSPRCSTRRVPALPPSTRVISTRPSTPQRALGR